MFKKYIQKKKKILRVTLKKKKKKSEEDNIYTPTHTHTYIYIYTLQDIYNYIRALEIVVIIKTDRVMFVPRRSNECILC